MPCGYAGKILRVDLSGRVVEEEEIDWEKAAQYIGGRGYASKIVYDSLKPKIDPLSEDNVLAFFTGPLTGTVVPSTGRFSVTSKSPLTGAISTSNCGGFFGVELKKAGYDGIVVRGRSEEPVYLYIEDGKAEIVEAGELWGKTTGACEDYLKSKHPGCKVVSIGPAGENKVRISAIMADKHRAAGRGGLGAVMGSKRLKAIAVKGKGKVEVANPYALKREAEKVRDILMRNPITGDLLGRYGTACLVHIIDRAGILPTRNFRYGTFEGKEAISGEALQRAFVKGKRACYACPIACGRLTRLPDGTESEGPEYESIWSMGANCGISDLESIAKANHLCDEYGIDTISFGNIVAFLMECYERGILKEAGIEEEIRWGDGRKLVELVRKTATREGIGDFIAEGVKRISEKIGGKEFAMHVKGLELPAYDPRGAQGMGLAYATANRGGDHLQAYLIASEILSMPRYLNPLTTKGKARLVKLMQDVFAVLDSMIMCKYTSLALFDTLEYEPRFYARLLTEATGFYVDEEEFRRIGERIFNLERLFNVREGFSRKDDTLPPRLLAEPMPSGPAKGHVVRLEEMLDEYYVLRGWNADGIPTEKKLLELGIIREPLWPKLQVALDLRNLDEAVKIALAAFKGGADWIEVGTPLVKSAGMEAVRKLRKLLPNATIIADLKTLDTGWLETEIAAQAGADVVCVSALAHDNTIKDAVGCARKYGVKVMADLLEVKDPIKRAKELEALGVDYICVHSGIDVQRDREQEVDRKVAVIGSIAKSIKKPLAVAGGIRHDTAAKVVKAGAKIVIVGSAITRSADPEKATRRILRAIKKAWSS